MGIVRYSTGERRPAKFGSCRLYSGAKMRKKKLKLATDLPTITRLTDADVERLDREAAEWRAAIDAQTATLERLDEVDLRIRLD